MLGNAAVAAGLALLAVAVGYACRLPAVRHAAWVLVLLKLVTPALFVVPLCVLPASWVPPPADPAPAGVIQSAHPARHPSRSPAEPAPPAAWWERDWLSRVADWALAVWAAGAIGWFVWQGRRIVRFHRLVRRAEGAPADVVAA